jgi:hypothetical protein
MKPTEQLLRDALELILPLAKGYANAHPVGSNEAYIKNATDLLAATSQQAEGEPMPIRFGFVIGDPLPSGTRVLTWAEGGCRPANDVEIALWDALAAPLPAQPQGQGAEPVAWMVAFEYLAGKIQQGPKLEVVRENWGKRWDVFTSKAEAEAFASDLEQARCVRISPLYAAPPSQAPEPAQQEAAWMTPLKVHSECRAERRCYGWQHRRA